MRTIMQMRRCNKKYLQYYLHLTLDGHLSAISHSSGFHFVGLRRRRQPSTNIKVHRSNDPAVKARNPKALFWRRGMATYVTALSIHKVHLILFTQCGASTNRAVPRFDWLRLPADDVSILEYMHHATPIAFYALAKYFRDDDSNN